MIRIWKLEDDNHYMVEGVRLSHGKNLMLSGGYLYCISKRAVTNLMQKCDLTKKEIEAFLKANPKHYPELLTTTP
jgi:hypothetical protein